MWTKHDECDFLARSALDLDLATRSSAPQLLTLDRMSIKHIESEAKSLQKIAAEEQERDEKRTSLPGECVHISVGALDRGTTFEINGQK